MANFSCSSKSPDWNSSWHAIHELLFLIYKSILFMLLTLSLVLLLVNFVAKNEEMSVPNDWQILVELIYDLVLNLETNK